MNLFDLACKLTLDSSEYKKGLTDAEKQGSGFGGKLKSAMKVGAAAVTAVTGTVTALTGALVSGTNEVAIYGDNIDKMSQKMGISSDAFQEWDAVLKHNGSSIESMSKGMLTLQKKAAAGSEAFEKLGLTQEQVASMSTEDLFAATISGLQDMGEGAERTALAAELLGGAAKELGPTLNMSAKETEEMKKRVHELGGVMSEDAVKSAAAYKDQLQDMQTAFSGMKRGLLSDFMPSLTTVMGGLTALFSGGGGIGKISEGISGLVDKIAENTPRILEVGTKIILSLGEAITANLPVLLNAGVDAIMTLGKGIVENLPDIIEAGLQVLLALGQGIAENLPELIPTIVDVVLQIVDTLTQPNTLSALIDASIAIILALADGLIDAIPQLIDAIPVIIKNLVFALADNGPKLVKAGLTLVLKLAEGILKSAGRLLVAAPQLIITLIEGIVRQFGSLLKTGKQIVDEVRNGFKQKIADAKNWGRDLIQNFLDGIMAKWNSLKQTVSNVAQTVKNFLGFSEPKEGPLSNFHTYAPDMMMLFAKGIDQNADLLKSSLTNALDFTTVSAKFPEMQYSGQYSVVGARGRTDSELLALLRDIRDNMDTDLYLDDGTLVGWMDKALGRRATQKARGNA